MMSHKEAERFRYVVLAAQRQGNRLLNEKLADLNISSSQAEVIQVLKEYQPITLKELGEYLICETGSPSRLIRRLINDGVVERLRHQEDNRSSYLSLTTKGEEISRSIGTVEQQLYEGFEQVLSEEELRQVNDLIGKLMSSLSSTSALESRGFL